MGKVVCKVHGTHGGSLASPAVDRAVLANERFLRVAESLELEQRSASDAGQSP